jgi:endoglycosylceramidase
VTGARGERDPLQAFVPHGYDIVVDTPELAAANSARVQLIFDRHAETAKRLQMPMIIGEWGAFGNSDERILPSAGVIQRLFEKHLCGDTYWDYGRNIQQQAYFETLCRSIPCRIAGRLLAYESDPETGLFTCRWKETGDITAPTIIYLADPGITGREIRLVPAAKGYECTPVAASRAVYLSIPPAAKPVERLLTVR